jgi:hypothetical protein
MVGDGVNKLIAIWRWGADSLSGLKIYLVEFDSTLCRRSSYKKKENTYKLPPHPSREASIKAA